WGRWWRSSRPARVLSSPPSGAPGRAEAAAAGPRLREREGEGTQAPWSRAAESLRERRACDGRAPLCAAPHGEYVGGGDAFEGGAARPGLGRSCQVRPMRGGAARECAGAGAVWSAPAGGWGGVGGGRAARVA